MATIRRSLRVERGEVSLRRFSNRVAAVQRRNCSHVSCQAAGYLLIAWEHGSIPRIAAALGVPDLPKWPDRYDLVREVDMTTSPPKCRWMAQMLMPGDAPTLPSGCGTP
jgi:hypothetical protein